MGTPRLGTTNSSLPLLPPGGPEQAQVGVVAHQPVVVARRELEVDDAVVAEMFGIDREGDGRLDAFVAAVGVRVNLVRVNGLDGHVNPLAVGSWLHRRRDPDSS